MSLVISYYCIDPTSSKNVKVNSLVDIEQDALNDNLKKLKEKYGTNLNLFNALKKSNRICSKTFSQFIPTRVTSLKDLFLPYSVNFAKRAESTCLIRFFRGLLSALIIDLPTLAFRLIFWVPRAIYNSCKDQWHIEDLKQSGVLLDQNAKNICLRIKGETKPSFGFSQKPMTSHEYDMLAFHSEYDNLCSFNHITGQLDPEKNSI